MKYRLLILTDSSGHSAENSFYRLASSLRQHVDCQSIDILDRGDFDNRSFFRPGESIDFFVWSMSKSISFDDDQNAHKDLRKGDAGNYDAVILRLPPPLTSEFAQKLLGVFSHHTFINHPQGALICGSKEYLLNFPELIAPSKICSSIEDIMAFANQHAIVLKPLEAYGGKGLIRIDGNVVTADNITFDLIEFKERYQANPTKYLAVKFLEQVSAGDKRIIVAGGKVIGASLRLPAKNSWLCNVSMGGKSVAAEISEEEYEIVDQVHPKLSALGVVAYGLDTLVGDNGKRVLSEINATSIGGIRQLEIQQNIPAAEMIADIFFDYIRSQQNDK